MRSMSSSACFISSMDWSYSYFASLETPQFRSIRECRKYWLIAVSSFLSTRLRYSLILGSCGFMALSLVHPSQ